MDITYQTEDLVVEITEVTDHPTLLCLDVAQVLEAVHETTFLNPIMYFFFLVSRSLPFD